MLQKENQGRQKKHTDRWLSLFMGISAAICMSIVLMMEASVTSLAVDLTGTVYANTLADVDYTLTGDTTINVDSLENDINILEIVLNGHTLRITGNSAHSIILGMGISGNGNVIIEGGSIKNQRDYWELINISGNIEVLGGNIEYTGTQSALTGNNILIKGGNITYQSSDSSPGVPIYADSNLTIEGGTITIDPGSAAGLHSRGNISISGGSITVNNSDVRHDVNAISSFGTISITGGEINLTVEYTGNNSIAYSARAILAGNGIELSDNTYISSPDGGSVTAVDYGIYHYSITDADGNVATHVHIKTRTGGNVVPGRPGATGGIVTSGGSEGKGPQLPPCAHTYEWRVINAATATSDGEEDYVCTKCGDVKEKRGLPALGVFETETANKILNAKPGATVYIECMPWNSFGHAVRDAIAKRLDVTVKASFLSDGYKGTPLKVTIPAGRVDLFDNNGYLGLCRAGLELGYDN